MTTSIANDTDISSDYWMISNFPSPLVMPSNAIANFSVTIVFDHFANDGEPIGKSRPYDVVASHISSTEDAAIEIKRLATEMLRQDYPDAVVF